MLVLVGRKKNKGSLCLTKMLYLQKIISFVQVVMYSVQILKVMPA